MKLFTLSHACRSGAHCVTCRDLLGGRAWRESLTCCHELPGGEVDFACPPERGARPWGHSTPYEIPADFDVDQERARLQQGGCCGPPPIP